MTGNMSDTTQPQNNQNNDEAMAEGSGNDDFDEDADDLSPQEFQALDNQMDELNSALDVLEEQNNVIHTKLMELLESNRSIRQQFKNDQLNGQVPAGQEAKDDEMEGKQE